ncbi:MAG: proprotein convertase P-domain-containing protein, partial [Pirellulaceae bacterium]
FPSPPATFPDDFLNAGPAESFFCDVNEIGDVCFTEGGRGWVYLEGQGNFNLDNQIVFDSPQDEADWLSSDIQPHGINDNGQIIVRTWLDPPRGAILTPVVPGPGISVSPTSGLVTDESGSQTSFDVVLDTQPAADVTIGITSADTTEGTVDPASLTFTPANWDSLQIVTVTGVDDAIEDGDIAYTIITAAATSADPEYNGLDADDVSVTNIDDDSPPGGGSETYDSADTPLTIPDNNSDGIVSNILVLDDYEITNLTVTLDITHPRPSDLDVYLIDPAGGFSVQLFNYSGNNIVPDFNGTSSMELWTLEVYDTKKKKFGTLNGWSITVDFD